MLFSCKITAEDPYSLCLRDYLQTLQPLQLALEYTWALFIKQTTLLDSTAGCLTSANAFKIALQQYAKAAHAEVEQLSQMSMNSQRPLQSEQMRAQLKPLKLRHSSMRSILKVIQTDVV